MADRIAFVKTGWSDKYQGGPVIGRHGYLNTSKGPKGRNGDECFNFMPAPDGTYYGYLPPMGKAAPKPDVKTGWLLIFVAAYRGKGPLTVVGWYQNATFTDDYKPRPEYKLSKYFETNDEGKKFIYCVSAKQTVLVDISRRISTIPGTHFRRASIIYVREKGRSEPWRKELAARAEKIVQQLALGTTSDSFPLGSVEHRSEVEKAAVETACRYLKKNGYAVRDRQPDKCGYDLLAQRKKIPSELHIEVKGTSLLGERFFISRNEYDYMSNPKWRLALVTDALGSPTLQVLDERKVKAGFNFEPMMFMAGPKKLQAGQ